MRRIQVLFLFFILIALLTSCTQGQTAKNVKTDTLTVTHLAKWGNDTLATLANVRTGAGGAGTGDMEGVITIWPVEGGATVGTATVTFDTTGAFAFMKYQYGLKAPLASPTFTGTVTLPSGLTGTVRVTSGVVSATASDTVSLGTKLAGKLTFADSTVLLAYVKSLIAAGSADSSIFATKYHVSSTYATKASPTITGNPTFAGSSTLKLFTGAGTLRSTSDGYVSSSASDTVGRGQLDADIYATIEASKHVTVGQAFTYFYDDSASTIATYNILEPFPIARTQHIDSALVNATGGTLDTVLIESYASPVAGIEDTEISGGRWNFAFYGGTSSNTGNNLLHVKVYSRIVAPGTTETLLFTASTGDMTGSGIALYEIRTVQPTFAINTSDRLIVKVYGITDRNSNGYVYFTHNGSSNYSNIVTPLVMKHNTLRGLQGGSAAKYYHLDSANAVNIIAGTPSIGAATGTSLILGGDSVLTKIQVLKNADSTTMRTYSNSLRGTDTARAIVREGLKLDKSAFADSHAVHSLGVKLPLVVGQYLMAVTVDSLESAPSPTGIDSTTIDADTLWLWVGGYKWKAIKSNPATTFYTVYDTVDAENRDARSYNAAEEQGAASSVYYLRLGLLDGSSSSYQTGIEFQLNIPKGATIDTCYVSIGTADINTWATSDSAYIGIYNVDNAPVFNDTHTHTIKAHSTIGDSLTWDKTWNTGVNGITISPNLATLLNTVINVRAGWVANQYVGFVLWGKTTTANHAFDLNNFSRGPATIRVIYH